MNRIILLSLTSLALAAGCASSDDAVPDALRKKIQESNGHETLLNLAKRYGLVTPSVTRKTITLKRKHATMVFHKYSRKALFNGVLIWMDGPIVPKRGKWAIAKADIAKTIDPLLSPSAALASAGFSIVTLDPGHGGSDAGAIGRRDVYEKKVVLDIAKRVRKKIKSSDTAVKLTREKDLFVGLSKRTAKAKRWGADIFVSIHVNSAHNSDASGIETYILPAAGFSSTAGNGDNSKAYAGNMCDKANMLLAYYVQKELLGRVKRVDRGVRRARFDVLRDAPCPAILVECCFVSNKEEEEKMLQTGFRDNLAEGIARGILAYIQEAKAAK